MLLPKIYGGYECTPQEFFRSAIDIAERDMSTAWAGGIIAVHAYQLAIMPPQAAEEVYADTPDTLISSSYNPAGAKVKTVDGGFELSGRWGGVAVLAIAHGPYWAVSSLIIRTVFTTGHSCSHAVITKLKKLGFQWDSTLRVLMTL